jgi:hypothetical protein
MPPGTLGDQIHRKKIQMDLLGIMVNVLAATERSRGRTAFGPASSALMVG